jgi:hypothetical protein
MSTTVVEASAVNSLATADMAAQKITAKQHDRDEARMRQSRKCEWDCARADARWDRALGPPNFRAAVFVLA